MLVNPTRPNAIDYMAFLYGNVLIPPVELPSQTGTATGGSTTTVVDTSQSWNLDVWDGYGVVDYTKSQRPSWISSNNNNTATFVPALPVAVSAGDLYLIAPAVVFTSLWVALDIVNTALAVSSCHLYTLAVYNLAADRLINYAPDQPNQTYFSDIRDNLKIMLPRVGVPSASSDNGTAIGILNPEFMKNLTLRDLQTLKTPYGRAYMEIALDYGPNLWGIN